MFKVENSSRLLEILRCSFEILPYGQDDTAKNEPLAVEEFSKDGELIVKGPKGPKGLKGLQRGYKAQKEVGLKQSCCREFHLGLVWCVKFSL